MLAGIHFAGEGEGDPDEHALACLPRSIFEKLGISLTEPTDAQPVGFDPAFLERRAGCPGTRPRGSRRRGHGAGVDRPRLHPLLV